MARTTEDVHDQNKMLSLLALVLSVLALLVSFGAFSRAGRLSEQVMTEFEQMDDVAQEQLTRLNMERTLESLQAEMAVSVRDIDPTWEDDVAQLRQDADMVYDTSTDEGRQALADFNAGLDQLEDQLREGSADAIQTVQNLLEQMQLDLETNPE